MDIKVLEAFASCEFEDCCTDATSVAYNRQDKKLMLCCEKHTDIVVEYTHPEYHNDCPNCGCVHGVN